MPSLSSTENEKRSEEPTFPLCSREQPLAHDSSQKQMGDKCVVTAVDKVPVIFCWCSKSARVSLYQEYSLHGGVKGTDEMNRAAYT